MWLEEAVEINRCHDWDTMPNDARLLALMHAHLRKRRKSCHHVGKQISAAAPLGIKAINSRIGV